MNFDFLFLSKKLTVPAKSQNSRPDPNALKSKALMAPIAGMTDKPFRQIVMQYGAGMVTSELLSANAIVRDSEKTLNMLPDDEEPRPVSAQIFGGDPDVMREAAIIVDQTPCDVIDLNFGCPVKKVTKGGGGAAILKDIKKLERMVKGVVSAVKKPVTAKIRSGWDMKNINAIETAKVLEGCGVSAVALHARTATQGYGGLADWGLIAEVASSVNIPVIGNGDITTPQMAMERLETSGCDFVMIGRAALGAPWIFREFNQLEATGEYDEISLEEVRTVIVRHLDLMAAYYGERPAVRKMRTRLGYYSKGMKGAARFRDAVNHCDKLAELRELIDEFLSSASCYHQA